MPIKTLAPTDRLGALDPVGFGKALQQFATEVARRPLPALDAVARFGGGLGHTGAAAAGRVLGVKTDGPVVSVGKDRRFVDRAWEDNAAFFATLQGYRVMSRLIA